MDRKHQRRHAVRRKEPFDRPVPMSKEPLPARNPDGARRVRVQRGPIPERTTVGPPYRLKLLISTADNSVFRADPEGARSVVLNAVNLHRRKSILRPVAGSSLVRKRAEVLKGRSHPDGTPAVRVHSLCTQADAHLLADGPDQPRTEPHHSAPMAADPPLPGLVPLKGMHPSVRHRRRVRPPDGTFRDVQKPGVGRPHPGASGPIRPYGRDANTGVAVPGRGVRPHGHHLRRGGNPETPPGPHVKRLHVPLRMHLRTPKPAVAIKKQTAPGRHPYRIRRAGGHVGIRPNGTDGVGKRHALDAVRGGPVQPRRSNHPHPTGRGLPKGADVRLPLNLPKLVALPNGEARRRANPQPSRPILHERTNLISRQSFGLRPVIGCKAGAVKGGQSFRGPHPQRPVPRLFEGPHHVQRKPVLHGPRLRDVFRGPAVQIDGVGRQPGTLFPNSRGEEIC